MTYRAKFLPLGIGLVGCILARAFGTGEVAIYFLSFLQLVIFLSIAREGRITAVGSFTFMYLLFFGVRPVYLISQKDTLLFDQLFHIDPAIADFLNAQWWGVMGLNLFLLGAMVARYGRMGKWRRRIHRAKAERSRVTPPVAWIVLLLMYQIASTVAMAVLAHRGTGLYTSGAGAYLYDLPAVMQAPHLLVIVLLLEKWLAERSLPSLMLLGLSFVICLVFSYLMRNVSFFRGFYLTGLMVIGIACLARWRPKVSYAWLCIPILIALPVFRMLGETRHEAAAELVNVLPQKAVVQEGLARQYWNFFNASGDMNIFDTFVAAMESKPAFRPYIYTWLYVPAHLVPRAVWKSKPANGILIDVSFMNGAPYSPGISGFFLLDGGILWMLGCMLLLGFILSYLDGLVLTMPLGNLQCCLYGIHVVNGMYLTRFYLWQWFYQVLYMAIPCLVIVWLIRRTQAGRRVRYRRGPLTA